MTTLYDTVSEGQYDPTLALLTGGADPNQLFFGESLVEIAVSQNYVEILKLLLSFNANPDIGSIPAIFRAIFNNDAASLKILVAAGANKELIYDRMRPLHLCVFYANLTMSNILIDGGANVNSLDLDKNVPLNYAVMKNNWDITRSLRKKNADPLIKAFQGRNALEYAQFFGLEDITQLLISPVV